MFSGIDDPRQWVLPKVIVEQSERCPDRIAVRTVDGETLTYGELATQASQVAGLLASLGVEATSRVAILASNSLDFVRAWAGVQRLGATAVLLNTELMGDFLLHPLQDSAPSLLVIEARLLPRLEAVHKGVPALERVLTIGGNRTDRDAFDA